MRKGRVYDLWQNFIYLPAGRALVAGAVALGPILLTFMLWACVVGGDSKLVITTVVMAAVWILMTVGLANRKEP